VGRLAPLSTEMKRRKSNVMSCGWAAFSALRAHAVEEEPSTQCAEVRDKAVCRCVISCLDAPLLPPLLFLQFHGYEDIAHGMLLPAVELQAVVVERQESERKSFGPRSLLSRCVACIPLWPSLSTGS